MTQNITLLAGAAMAVLIPPLVFLAAGVQHGMAAGDIASALVDQFGARRQNLTVVCLLGLVPLGVLSVVLWLARRLRWHRLTGTQAAAAGVLPVLLVLAWANIEFWPVFLPERVYPGFPHGLELVLGPGFYAPIALCLGLMTHAALWRSR